MENINNAPKLEEQILSRCRQTVAEYGPFFGKKIFTIVATNPDLKWKDDVMNGVNTLRNEVKVFVLKGIDIKSVSLKAKDIDGQPKIIFNAEDDDDTLVFPVVKPDFCKATRNTVGECIERLTKTNSKPMFFDARELPHLVNLLRQTNQAVLNFYEELSRKYLNLSETVRGMMDSTDRYQAEYLRQCGIGSTETEVQVKVTVETDNK